MKKPSYDIIIKFLDGTCTDYEYKAVSEWVDSSPESKREMELIRKIYETPDRSIPDPDVDAAYGRVLERIRNPQKESEPKIYSFERESSGWDIKGVMFNPAYLRAAVVLIGAMLILYFIYSPESSVNYKVITVAEGEQQELTLPDGSVALLDAGSTIMFSEEYGKEQRRVQLEGEGFFDVLSDAGTPFTVSANGAIVTVLGTKFNVRSWKSCGRTILAVEEGKVSFGIEDDTGESAVEIVSQGQVSTIEAGNPPSVPEDMDIAGFMSWKNREMYFQNTELSEVLNQMQRWYDVRFILPDKSLYAEKITFNVRNTTLEENLEVLSLVMNFEYEMEGKVISFHISE